MKHCGHEQTTPFCAYCGAELESNRPLEGLLRHVQSHIRSLRGRLAGREARVEQMEIDAKREREQRLCETNRRALQKWASWEIDLAEVVRKLPDPD